MGVLRIAMWSGPRNISTAMMRAWGNRTDTYVCDEPFYAHYLQSTGVDHPGAAEIIEHEETDWRKVVQILVGEIPESKSIFYQKHMTHHLLEHMERRWLDQVQNCFLIREPHEMLTSLIKNLPKPRLVDTGLAQQVEIFEYIKQCVGKIPPVLDARDVLRQPERMLGLLCDQLGVDFDKAMLCWPPGPRETDGRWAKHWYQAVEQSTGFGPYTLKSDKLPRALESLHEQCRAYYDILYAHRLGQ